MNPSGQRPRRGLTLWLLFVGLLFLSGGLVFLCAAVQDAMRLPIALVLLILGGALVAWAGVRWRRLQQLSPEVVSQRLADLATTHNGEVTVALVMSTLGLTDEAARAALARLEAAGLCRPETQGEKVVYIFPGLQESKVVRRCAYCGSLYSVREPLGKCPNCGGTIEVVKV